MDDPGLDEILKRLDPNVVLRGAVRQVAVENRLLLVVSDARADRMRVMTRIRSAEGLPANLAERMLQANFDAVLDARYAIAQGQVWSVFIHPLSPLTERQLLSGVAQVITAAETFGGAFTSGALVFGGGDSEGLHRERHERILEKGKTKI